MKYRTSQKEKIVSEYLMGELSYRNLGLKSGINFRMIHKWVMKYEGKKQKQKLTETVPQEDNILVAQCSSEIAFAPHYVKDYAAPGGPSNAPVPGQETVDIYNLVSYDCSTMQDMPDYNSERTYFICGIDTTLNIDSIFAQNINIYPNPSAGPLTIQLSEQIPIDDVTIKIFDPYNNLITEFPTVSSRALNFDFSSGYAGLYSIQFNFFSGAYIYSRKIMKM